MVKNISNFVVRDTSSQNTIPAFFLEVIVIPKILFYIMEDFLLLFPYEIKWKDVGKQKVCNANIPWDVILSH